MRHIFLMDLQNIIVMNISYIFISIKLIKGFKYTFKYLNVFTTFQSRQMDLLFTSSILKQTTKIN